MIRVSISSSKRGREHNFAEFLEKVQSHAAKQAERLANTAKSNLEGFGLSSVIIEKSQTGYDVLVSASTENRMVLFGSDVQPPNSKLIAYLNRFSAQAEEFGQQLKVSVRGLNK